MGTLYFTLDYGVVFRKITNNSNLSSFKIQLQLSVETPLLYYVRVMKHQTQRSHCKTAQLFPELICHQHWPKADVSHSISALPGSLET
jgi:hypothetical protein